MHMFVSVPGHFLCEFPTLQVYGLRLKSTRLCLSRYTF